jgi:hypothetical protein
LGRGAGQGGEGEDDACRFCVVHGKSEWGKLIARQFIYGKIDGYDADRGSNPIDHKSTTGYVFIMLAAPIMDITKANNYGIIDDAGRIRGSI